MDADGSYCCDSCESPLTGEWSRDECTTEVEKMKSTVMVVSFCRQSLGQTGDGHFSPIGGYDEEGDRVLVLDVARFKYPPYWVKLPELWEAMKGVDSATGMPRGYFQMQRKDAEQVHLKVGRESKVDASGLPEFGNRQHCPLGKIKLSGSPVPRRRMSVGRIAAAAYSTAPSEFKSFATEK